MSVSQNTYSSKTSPYSDPVVAANNENFILESTFEELVSKSSIPRNFSVDDENDAVGSIDGESVSENSQLDGSSGSASIFDFTHFKFKLKPNFYMLVCLSALKFVASFICVTALSDLKMRKVVESFEDPSLGQSEYLRVQSFVSAFQSITGIITSSYFGNLSDRKGRLFAFVLSAMLSVVAGVINLFIFSKHYHYNIYSFLLLLSVSTLDGGVVVLNALTNSYISDIVPSNERLLFFSTYQCVICGLSTVVPLLTAFIVNKTSNYATLLFSMVLYVLTLVGTWLFLSESLSTRARKESMDEKQRTAENYKMLREKCFEDIRSSESKKSLFLKVASAIYHTCRLHVVVDVVRPLKALYLPKTFTGSLVPRVNALILVASQVFYLASYDGAGVALTPYALLDLQWTSVDLSYFFSYSSVISTVTLLLVPIYLYPYLIQKKGYKILTFSVDKLDILNIRLLSVGLIFSLVCPLLFISTQGLYGCTFFYGLVSFAVPTIQNSLLKYATPNKTGEMLAGVSLLSHLNVLITPPVFLQVYDKTKSYWPTLFLVIPLVFQTCGFVLTYFLKIVEDPGLLNTKKDNASSSTEESQLHDGSSETDSLLSSSSERRESI
ncbi:hypothetical protein ACO0QE_001375 [Hanseniaspora vineae]